MKIISKFKPYCEDCPYCKPALNHYSGIDMLGYSTNIITVYCKRMGACEKSVNDLKERLRKNVGI